MITGRDIKALAEAAGKAIMKVYTRDDQQAVELKSDRSPLTEGDRVSHDLIVSGLQEFTPDLPVISEEGCDSPPSSGVFWLVDPLDGTKEFLKKTGEFTVNIALIESGRPIAGIVHAPAIGTTWLTSPAGAERYDPGQDTPVRLQTQRAGHPPRLVASRDHLGNRMLSLLQLHPDLPIANRGSSIKFCMIADAQADLYLRDGPTMPWDTAAAHAVLAAAGGDVLSLDGAPLDYSTPTRPNPQFIAIGDISFDWRSLISSGDK
ncbi:MAG: 3'(2'),5'-bisphosphate nucleotidase CysQ [Gemmatimonadaceae bacterium]|nr:3'(2'),5'-bisphosphate nucleotidase CysQ [Gemmatimonadaceae bacterium]